jgi:hypothetical protein
MKSDPNGSGTNADGTKSDMYCSYCYEAGKFTADCTAKEMQEFCKNKMKELGMSSFKAWLFSRPIPSLKRWKQR